MVQEMNKVLSAARESAESLHQTPYKIGVFGSAEGDFETILPKAKELGKALGQNGVIVVTGAATGLPHLVAAEAHKEGAKVWGYPAAIDLATHQAMTPGYDWSIYERMFFIPRDYTLASQVQVARKYRNVESTANSDAGIVIAGRWGTLNEFSNLVDMGKIVGVLTSTGGIADELPGLYDRIKKQNDSVVLFNDSPTQLVNLVLQQLEARRKNKNK